MIDIGGDDRAAARDLVADELRGDESGNRGAKTLAILEPCLRVFRHLLAAEIFPRGGKNHFLRDDPRRGQFILAVTGRIRRDPLRGDRFAGHGGTRSALPQRRHCPPAHRAPGIDFEPRPSGKPWLANGVKSFREIDRNLVLAV